MSILIRRAIYNTTYIVLVHATNTSVLAPWQKIYCHLHYSSVTFNHHKHRPIGFIPRVMGLSLPSPESPTSATLGQHHTLSRTTRRSHTFDANPAAHRDHPLAIATKAGVSHNEDNTQDSLNPLNGTLFPTQPPFGRIFWMPPSMKALSGILHMSKYTNLYTLHTIGAH